MEKIYRMSDSEKTVMGFVWAADGPVSSAKLLDDLKALNKEWKPNTVLTFLARLIEKGLLTSIRRGRSNEYISLISEGEYKNFETRSFLKAVHAGSVKNLITALYDGDDLTSEELIELSDWFKKRSEAK